jgi:DNA-cytosine methyltransferase
MGARRDAAALAREDILIERTAFAAPIVRGTFGSLFSGVGGIDLGLQRAGWRCVVQVEIDEFCRSVLARHWPDVPRYGDIREIDFRYFGRVELLVGGFPCQDLSVAGPGGGLKGKRSGLWFEFERAIRDIRPRLVLLENVPAIRRRGLGVILGGLAALGYDAWWDGFPAIAFGAHHERDRFFLVAWIASDANCEPLRQLPKWEPWKGWGARTAIGKHAEPLLYGEIDGWRSRPGLLRVDDGIPEGLHEAGGRISANKMDGAEAVTEKIAELGGQEMRGVRSDGEVAPSSSELRGAGPIRDFMSEMSCEGRSARRIQTETQNKEVCDLQDRICPPSFQESQYLQKRMPFGVGETKRQQTLEEDRQRIRALGNAVVPQIAEYLGRILKEM